MNKALFCLCALLSCPVFAQTTVPLPEKSAEEIGVERTLRFKTFISDSKDYGVLKIGNDILVENYELGFVLHDLKTKNEYIQSLPRPFRTHQLTKVLRGPEDILYALVPNVDVSNEKLLVLNLFIFQSKALKKKISFNLPQATMGAFNTKWMNTLGLEALNAELLSNQRLLIAVDPTTYHARPASLLMILNTQSGKMEDSVSILDSSPQSLVVKKDKDGELKEIYILGPSKYNYADVDRREEWKIVALNDKLREIWTSKPQAGGLMYGRSLSATAEFDFSSNTATVKTYETGWTSDHSYTVDLHTGSFKPKK